MNPNDVKFSINQYDRDGDTTDLDVFLHFGPNVTLRFDNVAAVENLIGQLESIVKEIKA